MTNVALFSMIEDLSSSSLNLPDPIPNIIKSATFQAKIQTNGKKQIRIKSHTTDLHIFVCNGGHSVSSKQFSDFLFSNYKIRIKNNNPVLMFGDKIIKNFLSVPTESNVIYWVSWRTKKHKTLKNRTDVFCLQNGALTNKIFIKNGKYNKKHNR